MNVASANRRPSSWTSVSPSLSFRVRLSLGAYWGSIVSIDGIEMTLNAKWEEKYLKDVRLSPSNTARDSFEETRHLVHDIDTVQSLAERSVDHGVEGLVVPRFAVPHPSY